MGLTLIRVFYRFKSLPFRVRGFKVIFLFVFLLLTSFLNSAYPYKYAFLPYTVT